jgi:hypothetical protein
MPEPSNVPPQNTPPEGTPDPNKDLSSIMEGITKLSDTVSDITNRLDTFDETLEGFKTAQPPAGDTGEAQPPAPKWKPKTWDEFPEKAKEVARQTFEEIEKEKIEKQEAIKKQKDELQSQIDSDFDNQLQKLEEDGAIPKVVNVKDPNDPGKQVRKELFALGIKYNSPDLVAMSELRNEWVGRGYSFDIKEGKWLRSNPEPFGASAPVGSSSSSAPSGTKPTYKEIHNLSMDEMVRRYNA